VGLGVLVDTFISISLIDSCDTGHLTAIYEQKARASKYLSISSQHRGKGVFFVLLLKARKTTKTRGKGEVGVHGETTTHRSRQGASNQPAYSKGL
jgi:hypothetical protein